MINGQSISNFLRDYSMTIVIILITSTALVALGVFDPFGWGSQTSASGFGKIKPVEMGFVMTTDGDFKIKFKNYEIADVNLWLVGATNKQTGVKQSILISDVLAAGGNSEIYTLSGFGTFNEGDKYSMNINIVYGTLDLNLTTAGTVRGIVTSAQE